MRAKNTEEREGGINCARSICYSAVRGRRKRTNSCRSNRNEPREYEGVAKKEEETVLHLLPVSVYLSGAICASPSSPLPSFCLCFSPPHTEAAAAAVARICIIVFSLPAANEEKYAGAISGNGRSLTPTGGGATGESWILLARAGEENTLIWRELPGSDNFEAEEETAPKSRYANAAKLLLLLAREFVYFRS